jgi:hypothetical protein
MDCCSKTCATFNCSTNPLTDVLLAILEALEAKTTMTFTKDRFPRQPTNFAMLINMDISGRPRFTESTPFKLPRRLTILNANREFFILKFVFVTSLLLMFLGSLKLRFPILRLGRRCPVRVD